MTGTTAAAGRSSEDQRFPKTERLTTRGEYLLVQQRGTRIHTRDLLVFVYPQPGVRRVGVTVSSKVGNAVERNRVKRLLREVWRREREALPRGNDIVFVAKRSAVQIDYLELRRQVLELGRRLSRRVTQAPEHV